MNSTDSGSKAEKLVAEELAGQGFKILDINWKRPHAEIDIVAFKDKAIYFVEVKYRSSLAAGDGFDYITTQKRRHMDRAAESWVLENNWQGGYELLAASVVADKIDIREV